MHLMILWPWPLTFQPQNHIILGYTKVVDWCRYKVWAWVRAGQKVPPCVWGECDFHVNWLHVSRIRPIHWWFWYQPATSPFNRKHSVSVCVCVCVCVFWYKAQWRVLRATATTRPTTETCSSQRHGTTLYRGCTWSCARVSRDSWDHCTTLDSHLDTTSQTSTVSHVCRRTTLHCRLVDHGLCVVMGSS